MYVKSCIYESNSLFEKTRDYEMRENRKGILMLKENITLKIKKNKSFFKVLFSNIIYILFINIVVSCGVSTGCSY